jgi:hypothetical protein
MDGIGPSCFCGPMQLAPEGGPLCLDWRIRKPGLFPIAPAFLCPPQSVRLPNVVLALALDYGLVCFWEPRPQSLCLLVTRRAANVGHEIQPLLEDLVAVLLTGSRPSRAAA